MNAKLVTLIEPTGTPNIWRVSSTIQTDKRIIDQHIELVQGDYLDMLANLRDAVGEIHPNIELEVKEI